MPAGILKTKNSMAAADGNGGDGDHIEDTANQRAAQKAPTATLWANDDPYGAPPHRAALCSCAAAPAAGARRPAAAPPVPRLPRVLTLVLLRAATGQACGTGPRQRLISRSADTRTRL